MEYLPLNIDLKGKACVVIGGGAIAQRKATLLARAGADITVVAPVIEPRLQQLVGESGGKLLIRDYQDSDLDQQALVIAATDDASLNARVAGAAKQRGLLVNVVDTPQHSNVIFPSIVDRSPVLLSVSSSGTAPVLARSLRAEIESLVPSTTGEIADFIGRNRSEVRRRLVTDASVREFWERVLSSPVTQTLLTGGEGDAQEALEALLGEAESGGQATGEVYLVGAGPGDPDLLTFKALRLMQKADVVLHDRLVSDRILDLTRRDAERIYVGKARSDHALPQEKINKLLVSEARKGKKIVRLKGGDPFIFGRGGEEIAELAENKIPFQIVPGITAASGCACYSGIPLTHRDYAQSVRFVTGHLKDGSADLPWQDLVQENQTVVIYMGLTGIETICQQLIAHGRAPSTPIALIEQGTTPQQQVHVGSLQDMPTKIAKRDVHAPTLIIIGEVVSLRDTLAWDS